MLKQLLFGLFLGWGAAIPLGPMNLEIIRRNLRFGTAYGLALGLGACSADVTYLVLLSLGALTILTHPAVLQIVGLIGSSILLWFGYSALRMKSSQFVFKDAQPQQRNSLPLRHTLEGYVLTMFNPVTILFWGSVSTQIAIAARSTPHAIYYAGLGVFLATVSWVTALNTCLHFTRHRLSERVMGWINICGGLLLIVFALIGFWHIFYTRTA